MLKYRFNPSLALDECTQWIANYFSVCSASKAVVGISGGKDSSVVAALCARALGKENVFGVLMPQGVQPDIQDSLNLVQHLGIPYITINIGQMVSSTLRQIARESISPSEQTSTNLPARIRMATLFAVAQSVDGRVANTCNLSEDYVGYSTLFGDNAGQFSPLAALTATEVKRLGAALSLPKHLVEKAPSDGLCGKTDEENLGFTYKALDTYIRTGRAPSKDLRDTWESLRAKNRFKLEMVRLPFYTPSAEVLYRGVA